MRVLLIEDDHATAQSIELMLKSEGFNVYTTDLGEEGTDLAKIYDYDLILLDLNLPDINGLDVLRNIRVARVNTPVMILTGCTEIKVKVQAFGLGADDYMTKPFHKDELIARTHAIIRRSKGHSQATIVTGNVSINLDAKTVDVSGRKIHLTGKEYQMMELLSLRKGSTLTKEMFLNHLYGGMDEPELKIVDVFMCKLRKKIAQANGGDHHIETVWGRGYVLRDPSPEPESVQPAEPAPAEIDLAIGKPPKTETVVVPLVSDPSGPAAPRRVSVLRQRLSIILGFIEKAPASAFAIHEELKKTEPELTIAVARSTLYYWENRGYIVSQPGAPITYKILEKGLEELRLRAAA